MIMPTFCVLTIGCKVNQAESAELFDVLLRQGLTAASNLHRSDWVFVNTCTVTHRADRDSRKTIRRAARKNPGVRIVALGCYGVRAPEDLEELPNVAAVWGNEEKRDLWGACRELFREYEPHIYKNLQFKKTPDEDYALRKQGSRSRAFLKVQDGCEAWCSYCIVPKVRGRRHSISPEKIEKALHRWKDCGEVVLNGIHLGSYGQDQYHISLCGLLKRLLQSDKRHRFRLGSIEPAETSRELLELISSEQRICRHLHLPVQSGSAEILEKMNRNCDVEEMEKKIWEAANAVPGICIGTDVIIGFPGEKEKHFQETLDFLTRTPVAYFHVFSYSPRSGTAACFLKDDVDDREKKRRSALLRELSDKKREAYVTRFLDRSLQVVLLNGGNGHPRGLSDNYIHMKCLDRDVDSSRKLQRWRLVEAKNNCFRARADDKAPRRKD